MTEQTPPKKPRKPKSKSTYLVLEEIPPPTPHEEDAPGPQMFKAVEKTTSMKAAQSIVDASKKDFQYAIVCVREAGMFKTETVGTRKIKK